MVHLFVHLILSANHLDGKWQGIEVKKGQLICGLHSLSEKTGISIRSLRTCLDRLEVGGEITRKSTNKFSIITIQKYSEYQQEDECKRQASDKQTTSKRQANDNKQELKNEKNEKKKDKKITLGEFENVFLSEEELEKLKEKYNGTLNQKIESLSSYMASQGKKYASHYATILSWDRLDQKRTKQQPRSKRDEDDETRARWARELLESENIDRGNEEVGYQIQRPPTRPI